MIKKYRVNTENGEILTEEEWLEMFSHTLERMYSSFFPTEIDDSELPRLKESMKYIYSEPNNTSTSLFIIDPTRCLN